MNDSDYKELVRTQQQTNERLDRIADKLGSLWLLFFLNLLVVAGALGKPAIEGWKEFFGSGSWSFSKDTALTRLHDILIVALIVIGVAAFLFFLRWAIRRVISPLPPRNE